MNPGILTPPTRYATMPRGLLGRPTPVGMPGSTWGNDPEAANYIARVEAADGAPLEVDIQIAIHQFVIGCKADGLWETFRSAGLLVGARTLAGALTPLVGSTVTNNNFVSGDYARARGLTGNNLNKSITLPFNGGDVPQNDLHGSTWIQTESPSAAANFPTYIGAGSSNAGSTVIGRLNNNGQMYFQNRTGSATFVASAAGFVGVARNNAAQFRLRIAGRDTIANSVSQTPYTAFNWHLFREPSTVVAFSSGTQSWWSAGTFADLQLLGNRVSQLVEAVSRAIR